MLPFASSRPKLSHDKIALVGDAGSMINPMSGEGIFYGMEAGYLLAKETFSSFNSQNENELNQNLKKYEKKLNQRFGKHFLSCTLARFILQSPFMTKRLLRIASVDKNTINFVVELLFDEARLTIKETFLLTFKFILPFKTLKFFSKSPTFSL